MCILKDNNSQVTLREENGKTVIGEENSRGLFTTKVALPYNELKNYYINNLGYKLTYEGE